MKKYKSKDCLFIYFQNNNIMVNKREKNLLYNFYFRQTAFSLILSLFFLYLLFFPTFFVSIFSYLSGTFTFFFADISGRNFLSSWTFLSGTFYPGGGWGCTCTPPAYVPARLRILFHTPERSMHTPRTFFSV